MYFNFKAGLPLTIINKIVYSATQPVSLSFGELPLTSYQSLKNQNLWHDQYMQRQPTVQIWVNYKVFFFALYLLGLPTLVNLLYDLSDVPTTFLIHCLLNSFISNWLVWLSTFYTAATLCIEVDYSPQERLLRQRKVSCINQIIMLHSTHLLEKFSLVHNKSLHYKKKYKKRIRQMHFSNLSYVTRVLLGLMALSFITEVLN